MVMPCYRSPSTRLDHFITDLENYLESVSSENVNILIGDLNIDILNTDEVLNSRYLTTLQSFGFVSYCVYDSKHDVIFRFKT